MTLWWSADSTTTLQGDCFGAVPRLTPMRGACRAVIHGSSPRSKIGTHMSGGRRALHPSRHHRSRRTLFAAVLLAPPALAMVAVSFAKPPDGGDIAAGAGPASVAVGDFNADGNPDLAVANQLSSTLSVLVGSADGDFTRPSP